MQIQDLRLIFVTGISGAGKTQAIRCLEDLGFFCVDNLPPALVPELLEQVQKTAESINKVALVADIRGGKFFDGLENAMKNLDKKGLRYKILFLEASDEVLIRRFKETRRAHPLSQTGEIMEGIIAERKILNKIKSKAEFVLDTSEMSVGQLKGRIGNIFSGQPGHLPISIVSFGFKYGVPIDVDLLIDVRFIPNPYYDLALRHLTGHNRQVVDFVYNRQVTKDFLARYCDLLRFLIPLYIKEGKSHLVVAIGCTGGRHRSVVLATKLAQCIEDLECKVIVSHRDIDRGVGGCNEKA